MILIIQILELNDKNNRLLFLFKNSTTLNLIH